MSWVATLLAAGLLGAARAEPTVAGKPAGARPAPALRQVAQAAAPAEMASAPGVTPLPLELKPRGASDQFDPRRNEADNWVRPVPKLPKDKPPPVTENPGGLFGLGATPQAVPKNAMSREPEILTRERATAGAPRTSTGASKVYGDEMQLRLDAALPVVQSVVGWTRTHRTAVLTVSAVVLLLVWARTRRSNGSPEAPAGEGVASKRRRRRYRRRSHRHSADASGSSSSSSRSNAGALAAAAGDGRSSGRHR